jgi:ribosome-interacting GTPase 1
MPANLTQQDLKAEQQYRQASTPQEELACLQTMFTELPKHKGTDKLQADLKQKISRLKAEIEKSKSTPSRAAALRIPRQGAGRAVIIGGPNAGKSKLLSVLTRATPEIADYPFTTREPQPGMMPWEDVFVQLIDTPPITTDVFDPSTQGLVRGADLVLLVVDLGSDEGGEQYREVIEQFSSAKTRLGTATELDEEDVGVTRTRTFLVLNKIDMPEAADRKEFFAEYFREPFERFEISCETREGLEPLRQQIFQAMDAIRVYTKLPTKKEADMDKPFTLKRGSTLLDLAELIHRDLAENLKSARVWGEHVHPGTTVKADYELHDRDIIEIQA